MVNILKLSLVLVTPPNHLPLPHILFAPDVAALCTRSSAVDCHCSHPIARISIPKLSYRWPTHRWDVVGCIRCWTLWVSYYWRVADRVVGTFGDSIDFHFDCCATVNAVCSSYWFSDTLVCRRWSSYLGLVSLGHRSTSNRHRPCTERPHMCHRNGIVAQIFSVTMNDAQSRMHAISDTLCTNNILIE